jgi:hypothetical protein
MRTARGWLIVAAITVVSGVAGGQGSRIDPERLLSERFGFTSREIAQARQGQPIVKVRTEGDELGIVGAVLLQGRKERLSDWLRNIEHFRGSAQLGTTHVVPLPPSADAFAGVSLDPGDLAELKQCRPEKCAIRLSGEAQARLQQVAWQTSAAASQATDVVRQMLLGYATAYVNGGHAGVAAYDGPQARRAFADDMRHLLQRATTLTELAPALVTYLDGFPAAKLPVADQIFYWSAMPARSGSILSVHHLVVYRPVPSDVWIVDKNVYASRYFDAGILVIGLYDTPDGAGYYAVAGSRVQASQLGGVAGTVLRRQIERLAADNVKMYLEWIRESLTLAGL